MRANNGRTRQSRQAEKIGGFKPAHSVIGWDINASAEHLEFLNALARRCELSTEQTALLWKWFCEQMLDWLINHELPVDLGFCKLHPSPYRVDWAERVYHMLKEEPWKVPEDMFGSGSLLAVEGKDNLRASLNRFGHFEPLPSHGAWTVRRRIDLELSTNWFRQIRRVEEQRLMQLSYAGYADEIIRAIRRRRATSSRLYKLWHEAALAPQGFLAKTGTQSLGLLAKGTSSQALRERAGINRSQHRVIKRARRATRPLPKANGSLPEVRAVQPTGQDVRNGRSAAPSNGAAGVLVLDADKSGAAKGKVLAGEVPGWSVADMI